MRTFLGAKRCTAYDQLDGVGKRCVRNLGVLQERKISTEPGDEDVHGQFGCLFVGVAWTSFGLVHDVVRMNCV